MNEPVFLSRSQVDAIHTESLKQHGGTAGVRDSGLVDSALAAAANTYYYGHGDLFDIAAAYAYHLAESQAYLDGNKRTGIASALTFLDANDAYRTPDEDELYQAMIDIANHQLDKPGLAAIFRRLAGK
jgi:death-on-curing protein